MVSNGEDAGLPRRTGAEDWSALMARAQNGDGESYRRLLLEITPYLRVMAARFVPIETEDAVQDILLAIHAIRHTYDPGRPFKPWLAGVARHRLIDFARRRARSSGREVVLASEHETFADERPNLDAGALSRPALHEAIGKLPAGQRQAIELLKLREMSLKQASVATGMSITALKVSSHRGMQRLRRLLHVRDSES
jgi:RNA polymerase sigma-70 factor (ECF subfamily)